MRQRTLKMILRLCTLALPLFCAAWAQAAPGDPAFLDKLRLPADPSQARMLREAANAILRSELGRALAAEYAVDGVSIPVAFDDTAECPISDVSGKKTMHCSAAALIRGRAGDRISFNRAILSMGDSYIRVNLPRILAHELLGHELSNIKAKKAGVASAYSYWINNELNAIMVEWIIAAQTGHPMDSGTPWAVTDDQKKYVKGLHTQMPSYAEKFDLGEMLHPGKVFDERLAQVETESKFLERSYGYVSARKWFIGHLLEKHQGQVIAGQPVERGGFRQLADYYDWWMRVKIPLQRRRLSEIKKAVQKESGRFYGRAGAEKMRAIALSIGSLEGSRFFKERTRELITLRKMLAVLLKGRPRPTVKFPGTVSKKALTAMLYAEFKNGCPEVCARQIPPGDISLSDSPQ
jgi:hypothetical protein